MTKPRTESHRVLLADGTDQWALWRCVCVRGTGFPVSGVLRLAAPLAATVADRLNAAQDEAEQRRLEAIEAVSQEIKAAERIALNGLIKAIQKLKKRKVPVTVGLPDAVRAPVESYAAADKRALQIQEEYIAAFAAEETRLSGELREIARDGRFREAILWQNRHVLKAGIDSLLRQETNGRRSSKQRQNEQAVASYLQRFCTKNDTIGFFGPVGWATLGEGDEPFSVRHGPEFLAQRSVFFEGWCIDAVADLLSTDPALRRGLAPRRRLFVRSDGEVMGQARPLPPQDRAVLALCNGETSARDLAGHLVAAGSFPDAESVYTALDQLQAAGLVIWGFDLPMVQEPERLLLQQIERLDEGAARDMALRALGELEAARQAVALSAGDDRALDAALQHLEDRFTHLTGLGPTRGHGETYAGRTLVYEDCRRGTEVDLGGDVLMALGPSLALVLDSARWLTHTVAELHRTVFETTYKQLCAETGSARIDLATFCRRVLPSMVYPNTSLVNRQIMPEFRRRWAEVLDVPEGGVSQVTYTSEELRPRVRRAFDAPGPGWTIARHHSPDLLIVARGPEAIQRGDYSFVLGELHLGTNTLGTNLFVAQHPSPEDLVAAMESDLPEPCVFPTLPKVWQQKQFDALIGVPLPGMTGRLCFGLTTAKDLMIEVTPAPPGLSSSRVLSVAELWVEPGADGLQVVSRDGHCCFDLLDFLQTAITAQIVGAFRLLPPRAHLPRVTIDRLILSRESWSFRAAELEFSQAETEAERFLGARRWADRLGLPRFVFVRNPYERKPFYLDLESPLSVDIFAREVRKAHDKSQGQASIRLSEMIPGPEETWLPDREGNLYASELRMVAVDLSGRSG